MLLVQAIDEFFNGYFSTHERSAKTRIAYRSDLDQMAAHAGNEFALVSLNASFIENWAADLRRRNYSPASNSDGDLGNAKVSIKLGLAVAMEALRECWRNKSEVRRNLNKLPTNDARAPESLGLLGLF